MALKALILLLAAGPALAQPLIAAASHRAIEISTGFTGEEIVVFGTVEGPGDILVLARGPDADQVVRRKVNVLGVWLNGPYARFAGVPSFYAISGTRPAWEVLPEPERQAWQIGLDALPFRPRGSQDPAFRAALLRLKTDQGLYAEHEERIELQGGRLFNVRIAFPATVPTGDYRIEALLVRAGAIVARADIPLRVERVGSAARINEAATRLPALYGIACIILAALAGWLGYVLFRRS
jgi:uncharacterized protein (TIGR02186 family)